VETVFPSSLPYPRRRRYLLEETFRKRTTPPMTGDRHPIKEVRGLRTRFRPLSGVEHLYGLLVPLHDTLETALVFPHDFSALHTRLRFASPSCGHWCQKSTATPIPPVIPFFGVDWASCSRCFRMIRRPLVLCSLGGRGQLFNGRLVVSPVIASHLVHALAETFDPGAAHDTTLSSSRPHWRGWLTKACSTALQGTFLLTLKTPSMLHPIPL